MNLIWSPEALEDLEQAIDYLAERNPTAAEKLASGERVRAWPYPPFRIFYQRTPDAFVVVRVYHHRREPLAR